VIATVRIAPMEQWCRFEREKMAHFPEVRYDLGIGFEVMIDTASMTLSKIQDCNGRVWKVKQESLDALGAHTGGYCPPRHGILRAHAGDGLMKPQLEVTNKTATWMLVLALALTAAAGAMLSLFLSHGG
jgi:hypothetical protein